MSRSTHGRMRQVMTVAVALAVAGCAGDEAPDEASEEPDSSAALVMDSSPPAVEAKGGSAAARAGDNSARYESRNTPDGRDGTGQSSAGASAVESSRGGAGGDTAGTIIAMMEATQGHDVDGRVAVIEDGDTVAFDIKLTGVEPGRHGFHVHRNGDCSANASNTGGHLSPDGMPHGGPGDVKHHLGDLGNLEADDNGVIDVRIRHSGTMALTGRNGIEGRALVLHKRADDLETQPAGGAGKKVACGVIRQSSDDAV